MKSVRNLIRVILFEEQNDEYKNFMQSYKNRKKAFIDSIKNFDDIKPEDIPNIISYTGSEGYDSDEEAIEELEQLIQMYKSLPQIVTLYRVVAVEDESKISIDKPGEHYVLDKWRIEDGDFLLSIGMELWDEDQEPYILTVNAPKSQIDVWQTIIQNVNFPHEQEVNLINKGKGAKIVSIEKMDM